MKWLIGLVLLTGCAGTQHVMEEANAKLAQAKAVVAEAEAKRAAVCAEALETLRSVESVAPFACGLVDVAPGAPEQAKATCAQRDKLPAAIRNVELACSLGK